MQEARRKNNSMIIFLVAVINLCENRVSLKWFCTVQLMYRNASIALFFYFDNDKMQQMMYSSMSDHHCSLKNERSQYIAMPRTLCVLYRCFSFEYFCMHSHCISLSTITAIYTLPSRCRSQYSVSLSFQVHLLKFYNDHKCP